jgi:hypothetical protein
MDMRFGTWKVRSSRSLRIVVEEISKYMLDLVGILQFTWDKGGT